MITPVTDWWYKIYQKNLCNEYYGKKLLSKPINVANILERDNKRMNSWLNYLIDNSIIPANLKIKPNFPG
ncbi:MAG: hypothetical protein U9R34_02395 [Nanoarchaeota archaeon]|nr:hypothetical protein [Nanoarchaeota archaeon]